MELLENKIADPISLQKEKKEIMELKQRFKWLKIEGKDVLYCDISNTSEKELLALLYMTTDFTLAEDKHHKDLFFLIEHKGGAKFTMRFLKESMVFLKSYNCFEKAASFGKFDPIMIAMSKLTSKILKRESKMFKEREDAVRYLIN